MQLEGNLIIVPGKEHSLIRLKLVEKNYQLHFTLDLLINKRTTTGTY